MLASRVVPIHPTRWLEEHDFWITAVLDVDNAVNIARKIEYDRTKE